MGIRAIRSDRVYREMMQAPAAKRADLYRYRLMRPFQGKWDCYGVPLRAREPGGYDVVMASAMLGHLPPEQVDEGQRENIERLSSQGFWDACQASLERAMACFLEAGVSLPVRDCLYTVLLANPESPYIKLSEGYCGDGGIPGYVFGCLVPSEETLQRLPAALAHEYNHTVRFQFQRWRNDITLGGWGTQEGLLQAGQPLIGA